MRTTIAVATLVVAALLSASQRAQAAEFEQKWIYVSANFHDDTRLNAFIDLMREARAAGVTHVLLSEAGQANLANVRPDYFPRVSRALAMARIIGVSIIPTIYPTGYGGPYLRHDYNLAAGIPARDVPFIVKARAAAPDPASAPAVLNAGFDEAEGHALASWRRQNLVGTHSFVDTEVKRSGRASWRIDNLGDLPEGTGGVRVRQALKVRPFQYYRLSVWVKSENLAADKESYVYITSNTSPRRNTYTNLRVQPTQDWTRHVIPFNTLESDQIELSIGVAGATAGTVWFDELSIEPAGFVNVLRRELTPLVVTSEDGLTIYEEGKDFEPVVDKDLAGYRVDRDGPRMILTGNSRIGDGDRLLVSYFHPMTIYDSQMVISISDPKVFDLMEEQMRLMAIHWPAPGYFIPYDEVRVGGWELQPDGAELSPGELVANHLSRGLEFARRYAPNATLYIWSDMFSPYHNARPFEDRGYYYLVNGNWTGAWEGLPSYVVVANWYSPDDRTTKWFAGRGNRQILCGYYDGPLKPNISRWMDVSRNVPGVIGIMYTTWRNNYGDMAEFFRLVREYPAWLDEEAGDGPGMSEE